MRRSVLSLLCFIPLALSPAVATAPPFGWRDSVQAMEDLALAHEWEKVLPAAERVMAEYQADKKSLHYVSACYNRVRALHELGRYAEVLEAGDAFLHSVILAPGQLAEPRAGNFGQPTLYMLVDACLHLGEEESAMYNRALEYVELYERLYPMAEGAEADFRHLVFYSAVVALAERCEYGDEASREADMVRAQSYCTRLVENWPEHVVCPVAQLKLGALYERQGKLREALLTYMNVYHRHLGSVAFAAPACLSMSELLWRRNMPAEGARAEGNFRHSDRWQAWNTASNFVHVIRRSGQEAHLGEKERERFRKVEKALQRYAADPAVQAEAQEEEFTHSSEWGDGTARPQ